jgi:hypothetical protein
MTTYSVDFLAGLIVGEGCFTLSVNRLKQSKTDWLRITPIFSISMTDFEVMENVAHSFKEYDLPVYLKNISALNAKRERRPALNIHISGIKRCHRISSFFLPHLIGNKRAAAEVVRDYCEHRLTRHHRGISEYDIECIERIRKVNGTNGVRRHSVADLRDYKMGQAERRLA